MKHKTILSSIALLALTLSACSNSNNSSNKNSSISSSKKQQTQSSSSSSVKPDANAKNRPWTYKNNIFDAGIETYKFTGYKVMNSSDNDKTKVLVLFCNVTNNSNKEQDPSNVYMVVHAYQKTNTSNIKLDAGMQPSDKNGDLLFQERTDNLNNKLLPGKTAKACMFFNLKNNNPVKVTFEDSEFNEIGSKTYNLD